MNLNIDVSFCTNTLHIHSHAPVRLVGEPREAVHERVLRAGDLGLVTLLGGDPVDLGGRGVGVQEAVHYGDSPRVHRDLVVLNRLVVTHRPIFE